MATNARAEMLNALRDIECFSGNFKSAYALMYAYLTGTEDCRDPELAEAFEHAYKAITHRERLQKRNGCRRTTVHAKRLHARGRKADSRSTIFMP
jgi:hypothetical protein